MFNARMTFFALTTALFLSLTLASLVAAEPGSSQMSAEIEQQQRRLDGAHREIADIGVRIKAEEITLEQNRQQLADATALLRTAEDRYNNTLDLFEHRITAIYKLGDEKFYSVLMSSESFIDVYTRLSHLTTISESDRELVDRIRGEAREVRKLHAAIDDLKQTRAEDIDTLKARKSQLEAQVESDKKKLDSAVSELARIRAREQEQEALLVAEDESSGAEDYMLMLGPSILTNQQPADLQPTGAVLTGVASWYGPGFHGNTTANGERYNQYAFTAAHKTLPFNTWVKVTFNGRSVFLRINDRGPYIAGRIIDLSYAGAQAIGLSGIGRVTVEIYR